MKVLVAVKRVIDYQTKVRIKADGLNVETDNVKMSMNPFDEIALEAAVRLKEQGTAAQVVACSVQPNNHNEVLRQALALGADQAILVKTQTTLEPLNVAKVLQALVEKEQIEMVFLGKQAIDDDCNQTGQMLAALLNWPQATFVSQIEVQPQQCVVAREVDEGLQKISLTRPCVITTDLRLNEPRFASLPNIMKAKSKPINEILAQDLALSIEAHTRITKLENSPQRSGQMKSVSIQQVLDYLLQKELL